jgi:hypothetical protein
MGVHCGSAVEQAPWIDLFERYAVRAVFAGHDHGYARAERNGIRYFVSGGGGAPLYGERPDCSGADHDATRVYLAKHHYMRVQVFDQGLDITAVGLDGVALDHTFVGTGAPTHRNAPPLVAQAKRPTTAAAAALAVPSVLSSKWGRGGALLVGLAAIAFIVVRRRRSG